MPEDIAKKYDKKEIAFFKEKGITIPEKGSFEPGTHCPGKEKCYGHCFGTQGFTSLGNSPILPCRQD